jgi:hypothetical protein
MPLPKFTAAALVDLLRALYAPLGGWAFLEQVPISPGHDRRLADGLAVRCWQSRRGPTHALVGFEVKVSRSDWLREVAQPEKAELFQYCDFWYVVAAAPDIVRPGELPRGWGLLVPEELPGTIPGRAPKYHLVKRIPGPRLSPCPVDRPLLAAVLRRASEAYHAEARVEKAVRNAERRIERLTDRICQALGVQHAAARELKSQATHAVRAEWGAFLAREKALYEATVAAVAGIVAGEDGDDPEPAA